MQILQIVLLLLVILAAFPLGFFLAKLTKEELKSGRNAFKAMIIVCLLVILITFFLNLQIDKKIFLDASMLFIMVTVSISLKKSYKAKPTRKKEV